MLSETQIALVDLRCLPDQGGQLVGVEDTGENQFRLPDLIRIRKAPAQIGKRILARCVRIESDHLPIGLRQPFGQRHANKAQSKKTNSFGHVVRSSSDTIPS